MEQVSGWQGADGGGRARRGSRAMPRRAAKGRGAATGTTGTVGADFGPLWAYARAVPWSAYVASPTEPAAGYSAFAPNNWATLYNPGQPTANNNYPSGTTTPYKLPSGSSYFTAPSAAHQPGVGNRRVLNVALLNCPIGGAGVTTATVLGIGRFFMTVAATATSIFAEFAGAVPEQSIGGQVELIQ
jgi:hypothetical protein